MMNRVNNSTFAERFHKIFYKYLYDFRKHIRKHKGIFLINVVDIFGCIYPKPERSALELTGGTLLLNALSMN
ncbi:hypothetical protein D1872_131300 [compost metagenome]